MYKHDELIRKLMKYFGEELEEGMSYEHIYKVLDDNLYNLKEVKTKQNKYQSALNYLDWHCNVEHKEQQELLQELIDKETPMKPIEGKGFTVHDCPTCDDGYIEVDGYYKLNRCVNCGQKIDWSAEE